MFMAILLPIVKMCEEPKCINKCGVSIQWDITHPPAECSPAACYNANAPWKHDAKMSDTKGQVWYDSTYLRHLGWAHS